MKKILSAGLILFFLFLMALERKQAIYQHRASARIQAAELKLKMLEADARFLKIEMGLVTVDAFLARAKGWENRFDLKLK